MDTYPYRLKTAAELEGLPYWETATNPLKILRETVNKTQREIALIAGVSEQIITRHEMGMINQPSVKVIRALAQTAPLTPNLNFAMERLYIEYTKWVYKRRRAFKDANYDIALGDNTADA